MKATEVGLDFWTLREQLKKPRNKFEKKLHAQLKRSGLKFAYESDRIPYILNRIYTPDFVCHTSRGIVYIEAKGYLRPEAKSKMVAVKKLHPELDIRIIFYAMNKKYIKWAEKVGIPWAVGKIPSEWLQ